MYIYICIHIYQYMAITAMTPYQTVSFEELRVGDYLQLLHEAKSAQTPTNAQSPQKEEEEKKIPNPFAATAPTIPKIPIPFAATAPKGEEKKKKIPNPFAATAPTPQASVARLIVGRTGTDFQPSVP
jgi:hypothetical protein